MSRPVIARTAYSMPTLLLRKTLGWTKQEIAEARRIRGAEKRDPTHSADPMPRRVACDRPAQAVSQHTTKLSRLFRTINRARPRKPWS